MCALALALKKVPIFGPGGGAVPAVGSFENPSYAVTVDDTYAAQAREKAEREADALRMVSQLAPKYSPSRSGSARPGEPKHVSEAQAVSELTSRPPLAGMESNFGYSRDDEEDNRRRPQQSSPTFNDAASFESGSKQAQEQARYRAEGIEQIRADLVKRNSTRGRRRAGEGVPASPLGGQPELSVTQYDADGNAIVGSHRQMSYDVVPSEYPGSGIGRAYSASSRQPAVSPRVEEAAQESFSLYQQAPPSAYVSPYAVPAVASSSEGGLAPSAASVPVVRGARPRGASVSQVEEEDAAQRGRWEDAEEAVHEVRGRMSYYHDLYNGAGERTTMSNHSVEILHHLHGKNVESWRDRCIVIWDGWLDGWMG